MSSEQTTPPAIDLSDENVEWDFKSRMSYGDYLRLKPLLACQAPRTKEHDELLFIVIHQASELWIKLCLHEIAAAMEQIRKDELGPAFKMLARVARIQASLIQSWDILSTMTPFDYAGFRDSLGQSSGFQSYQYRLLEFMLGNKNAEMLRVFESDSETHKRLSDVLHRRSLYDEALALLDRRGLKIPKEKLERDFSQPYLADAKVTEAWAVVYRDVRTYWDLYELAEKLVDVEYRFQLWRFSHMKTVERIIGHAPGTGGTAGVSYLAKALDLTFYPELWSVRSGI